MGYSGIVFILLPQTFLIMAAILLVISLGVIYGLKRLVKLRKEEIANEQGSLLPLVFTVWGINLTALSVSFFIMDAITLNNPFFSIIHSEWAGTIPHAFTPELYTF